MARPAVQLKAAGWNQHDQFLWFLQLAQDIRDLLEKLDSDGGVTDTDYESTLGNAASLARIAGLTD